MIEVYFVCKTENVTPGLLRYSNSLTETLMNIIDLKISQNVYLKRVGNVFKILNKVRIKIPGIISELLVEVVPNPFSSGIVHFSNQTLCSSMLWRKYRRSVVTIHDLVDFTKFNLFGELRFGFIDKFLRRFIIKNGAKKASKIITFSEHTKREIIKYLKVPEAKINVIYPSFNSEFHPIDCDRDPNCILYVGSEEPRKNVVILIRALAQVKSKLPNVKLIKVGRSGWDKGRKMLEKEISLLGLKNEVIFKEYVEDIVKEYCKASLFVFPSLYEGFGTPVFEAMACGTPVVCSNVPPLPELVGDAAVLVNSIDADGLADAIYSVLTDEKKKEELIKKGLYRSKFFSWEKATLQTVKLYEELTRKSLRDNF